MMNIKCTITIFGQCNNVLKNKNTYMTSKYNILLVTLTSFKKGTAALYLHIEHMHANVCLKKDWETSKLAIII